MPPIVLDLIIDVLIIGLTYALMSEGLWGAALMFFNVLFAGMISLNFYEPLAGLIASNVDFLSGFADTLCLLGIFAVALVILRLTTESIAPSMVRFPTPVYHAGRVFFGFAASVLTIGFIVLGFETAPVHKKILGAIDYSYQPPHHFGIDREWLSFFQYSTGVPYASHTPGNRDPFREYGDTNLFDPKAEWLINHQEARPYGTGSTLDPEGTASGGEATKAAAGGAAPAAGGAPPP